MELRKPQILIFGFISGLETLCESSREEIKINVNNDYPTNPDVESSYLICGDDNYKLIDLEIIGNNIQWLDSNNNIVSDTTIVQNGDEYYVFDESPSGCISDIISVSFEVLDISEIPDADDEQEFDLGDDLTTLEVQGENLRWYDDSNKENLLSLDTKLEEGKTYYVTQEEDEHCESEVLGITVYQSLNVEEHLFIEFTYAPNPIKETLIVNNPQEGIEVIELYDLNGRRIKTFSFSKKKKNEVKIDFSNFNAGIYFMKVGINNNNKTVQLIKK